MQLTKGANNLGNQQTRRAYENALQDFMRFTGIVKPDEFRTVTRSHVIAWRDDLAKRELSGMTTKQEIRWLASSLPSMQRITNVKK